MTATLAILWTIGADLHTGRLNVLRDRLELRSRRHALSIPLASVERCSIDRGPAVRIRGLPVLRLELSDGMIVRVASLESVTLLKDLADRLAVGVPCLVDRSDGNLSRDRRAGIR
jgi:hypothetical protein